MNLEQENKNTTLRILSLTSTMNEKQVQINWSLLKKAFEEIQEKQLSDLSFEEIYRNAYAMVLYRHGEKVYTGLTEVVTDHLVKKVRVNILSSFGNNFLETLNQAWNEHLTSMDMISGVLMYLDRVYVPQRSVNNVYNLGLVTFRDHVVRNGSIRDILRDTLLDMVMRERKGDVVNRLDIKNACHMLMVLGIDSRCVYEEEFEKAFLVQSAEFYRIESQKFLKENNASAYINKVEQWIHNEVDRAKHYLDQSTEKLIIKVVDEELISKHVKTIVKMEISDIVYKLKNQKTEDLACMYNLFRRVDNGLEILAACVSSYLQEQGNALVPEIEGVKSDALNFINDLLEFKDGFELLLNLNPKSSEYISLFIDDKLKRSIKEKNEIKNDKVLDKTIVLLRHLHEKDAFEVYYKQHLAKRLLFNMSVPSDSEKIMINKLKKECGLHFTSKLDGMLKDMYVSNMMMEEFKTHIASSKTNLCDIDLNVRVLTPVFWAKQSETNKCIIPIAPRNAFEVFRRFYLAKHSGRQLKLQPHLGFAELSAVFFTIQSENVNQHQPLPSCLYKIRKHIIQVSTYQMCVLMLFNTQKILTFEEIASKTDIPSKDLIRALRSLTMSKPGRRILTKIPNTNDFDCKHQFTVNDSFTSRMQLVKLQASASKCDLERKRKETRIKLDGDRKHEIEAAIVRIMKSKKQMVHENLLAEVTEQLKSRFLPKTAMIKTLIESLIQREYLSRGEEKNIYTYVT